MKFLANSFNVAWAVQILFGTISMYHVDHTINGCRIRALCTVKGKIPSPAAVVAVVETKIAGPVDSQRGFVRHFLENTFLSEEKNISK